MSFTDYLKISVGTQLRVGPDPQGRPVCSSRPGVVSTFNRGCCSAAGEHRGEYEGQSEIERECVRECVRVCLRECVGERVYGTGT